MRFQFAAGQIHFGEGAVADAGTIAAGFGDCALLVSGVDEARVQGLEEILSASGVAVVPFAVEGEPTLDVVRNVSRLAREKSCNLVVGIGGGSALDTAKAAAAMIANPGDVLDYLEVIGAGKTLQAPAAPVIAIPTTAGTGSEVTRNAVIASPEHRFKASLRHVSMVPKAAIVDPELTYSLPPEITASTGLDALTQLIEPFVSIKANPLTDALCRDGIRRAARSLRRAFENGSDPEARRDMALASLFGGLALANAGLGAVHGFAAPIGGMFPAPHGAVCARLLPGVMQANLEALRREGNREVFEKYREIAELLTGEAGGSAEDGAAWVSGLVKDLGIPGLEVYGIRVDDVPEIAEKAASASSMKGNPVKLGRQELEGVLRNAI